MDIEIVECPQIVLVEGIERIDLEQRVQPSLTRVHLLLISVFFQSIQQSDLLPKLSFSSLYA